MKATPRAQALFTLTSERQALELLHTSVPQIIAAVSCIMKTKGHIILIGIGKSGFIAQKIAATFTSLGRPALYLHPVDAIHGDIGVVSKGDVVIALSYSGASTEVTRLVSYMRSIFGVSVISLTKNAATPLGKISDSVIPVPIVTEGSPHNLAPMASTTAMLVLGDMLASAVVGSMKREVFATNHPGGSLGLELVPVMNIMKKGRALPVVESDASFTAVLKEADKKRLGIAGVREKGRLVGVITDGDIRRALIKGANPRTTKAEDMMTRDPKTIPKQCSLKQALDLMEQFKITTLFVVESGIPIGLVHIHDILSG